MKSDEQLRTALRVAFRQVEAGATTESESIAILNAMVTHNEGEECEGAAHLLFYYEGARRAQLELAAVMRKARAQERPIAPAKFLGVQNGLDGRPAFELWNLTAKVGNHPEGSSVSRETIEHFGYRLPPH